MRGSGRNAGGRVLIYRDMWILNITFLTDQRAAKRTLEAIRRDVAPALLNLTKGGNPRLALVRKMQGQCVGPVDPISLTFQMEFAEEEYAASAERESASVLAEYSAKAGDDALTFTSLIETLPLGSSET